jgi:hypothetical protein
MPALNEDEDVKMVLDERIVSISVTTFEIKLPDSYEEDDEEAEADSYSSSMADIILTTIVPASFLNDDETELYALVTIDDDDENILNQFVVDVLKADSNVLDIVSMELLYNAALSINLSDPSSSSMAVRMLFMRLTDNSASLENDS